MARGNVKLGWGQMIRPSRRQKVHGLADLVLNSLNELGLGASLRFPDASIVVSYQFSAEYTRVCGWYIVGPFQSDALLVPEHCVFDHVHNSRLCSAYSHWNHTALKSCAARGYQLQNFAILQPCGVDKFNGVEFVCCPPEKREMIVQLDVPHARVSFSLYCTRSLKLSFCVNPSSHHRLGGRLFCCGR